MTFFLFNSSKPTAIIIITPLTTNCHWVSTFNKPKPLDIIAKIITPIAAPVKVPIPPTKLTPPRTTAATTWNSNRSPAKWFAEPILEDKIIALIELKKEQITKALNFKSLML